MWKKIRRQIAFSNYFPTRYILSLSSPSFPRLFLFSFSSIYIPSNQFQPLLFFVSAFVFLDNPGKYSISAPPLICQEVCFYLKPVQSSKFHIFGQCKKYDKNMQQWLETGWVGKALSGNTHGCQLMANRSSCIPLPCLARDIKMFFTNIKH